MTDDPLVSVRYAEAELITFIVAIVLVAHGVGHIMGPLQVFKVATITPAWQGDSWLVTGVIGTLATQVVGLGLWTTALVGFVALAAVLMGWLPQEWWQPLAVISAIASLLGLALFPLAFPVTSSVGALVVDVGVLVAVLWFHVAPGDLAA